MIKLPDKIQDSLLSPFRYIQTEVHLEIDGSLVDITEDIIDFNVQETLSEGNLPYGQITFNVIDFTLDNLGRKYMLNNTASPYYGKLKAGQRIQITYIVNCEDGETYPISWGYFYTDIWKCSTDNNQATLTAMDYLSLHGTKPTQCIEMLKNVSYVEVFRKLFELQKIPPNMYSIDSRITGKFVFWWPIGETFADTLQELAIISQCNIFCDKQGRIKVMSISQESKKVLDLTDGNVIMNTKAQPQYKESFQTAAVKYQQLNGLSIVEIYASEEPIGINAGMQVTKEFRCSVVPVADIINVSTYGSDHVEILDFVYVAGNCRVTFRNNSNTPIEFNVRIFGRKIDTVEVSYANTEQKDQNSTLELVTPYVLQEQDAIRAANNLTSLYGSTTTMIELDIRALPNLELYDRILLESTYVGITKEFYVTALTYTFDGSLMGTVQLSTTEIVEREMSIFISPGLTIRRKGV